jgi:glycosyltransferase involved in cell wall biosynthesis
MIEVPEYWPFVSVILPTYNRANLVGNAIESILQQTYKNIEIIVVDDGSTDETPNALSRFGAQIKVTYQKNAGPSAARNRGIAEAKGEIVAFLDSDDQWLPTKIERQVAVLQRADSSVPCCVCNAELRFAGRPSRTSFRNACLDPAQQEGLWTNTTEVLTDRYLFFNQVAAVRRSALEQVGGFNESLRFLEDYDLALRLSLLGPFAFIKEPLVIWNEGSEGSLSAEAARKMAGLRKIELKIRENVLKDLSTKGENNPLEKQMRSAIARTRRRLWIAGLREKQPFVSAAAGYMFDRVEHYFDAAIRRSPWFIPMKTTPLPEHSIHTEAVQS